MDMRVGLLFILMLGASRACDARQLANKDVSDMPISHLEEGLGVITEELSRNENVCTLCEEFATQALDYVTKNKTQTEIIDALHLTCSELHSFKQQCITLVDYYAPLFFLEITFITPANFCQKVNLCQQVAMISSKLREDSCGFCQQTVSEIKIKLKDPDTQIEIIQSLLKACNSMQNYTKKCKRLVFEYGPLILANTDRFLETADLCTTLHACSSPPVSINGVSSAAAASLVSDA